jgi:hypothetical protein
MKNDKIIYIPISVKEPPSLFGLPDDYYIIEDSGEECYFMEGDWYVDENEARCNEHHEALDVDDCMWLRPITIESLLSEQLNKVRGEAFEAGQLYHHYSDGPGSYAPDLETYLNSFTTKEKTK